MKSYLNGLKKTSLFIILGLLVKLLNFFKDVYVFPKRDIKNNTITINIISKQNKEFNIPSPDYFFSMKLFKKTHNIFFDTYHFRKIEFIKIKFNNFSRFSDIRKFIEKINFNNILFTKKNLRTKLIKIFL